MTDPKVSRVKLSDISPDPANANRHTERGHAMLRDSISQHGFAEAGTLDKDGRIIGGNHRFEVAGDLLEGDEALVIEVDGKQPVFIKRNDVDLATPEGRKLAYALNRVAQVSIDFNPEQLAIDIAEGVSLDGLFDDDELEELLEGVELPDEFPEYDEGIADDVEFVTCPHCGEKFPK